jgi:hypothetical protein
MNINRVYHPSASLTNSTSKGLPTTDKHKNEIYTTSLKKQKREALKLTTTQKEIYQN